MGVDMGVDGVVIGYCLNCGEPMHVGEKTLVDVRDDGCQYVLFCERCADLIEYVDPKVCLEFKRIQGVSDVVGFAKAEE